MIQHQAFGRIGGVAAARLAITLTLSGCGATAAPGSAPASNAAKAGAATSLADLGTLADLETAAKAEGSLNVIALPRDWANYGAVIDASRRNTPRSPSTSNRPTSPARKRSRQRRPTTGWTPRLTCSTSG